MTIRTLVVDDQVVFRMGLTAILDAQDDVEVVGEAVDGASAVVQARALLPDVILMDVRMPGVDGIEATRRILDAPHGQRTPRVVVLTTFDVDDVVLEAIRAGASGFLLKDATPAELVHAVRTVHAGESLLAPRATTVLIDELVASRRRPADAADRLAVLTDREREVFVRMAGGASNAEIALALHIAEQTTKSHVSRILAKLDLRDRVHAVVLGYEIGAVTPGG